MINFNDNLVVEPSLLIALFTYLCPICRVVALHFSLTLLLLVGTLSRRLVPLPMVILSRNIMAQDGTSLARLSQILVLIRRKDLALLK